MRRQRSQRTRRKLRATQTAALQLEALETRQLLSVDPISIDGTGNNIDNPEWGSTHEELLRITTVEYTDGIGELAGQDRPSARVVSNEIAAQEQLQTNDRLLTDYVWIWGQFLDHDIDLTEGAEPAEAAPIAVPTGDQYFDPFGTGTAEIGFSRSQYVDPSLSSNGVRQQTNSITAYIDGSVIYGSDQVRADELRTFSGGRLKTSDGDLLPFNEAGLDNAGGPSSSLFLAGDVRANENVALLSMHTVWVREHNRIADELASQDPSLSDEQLYQRARQLVVAEMQVVTYNEFLPSLVGNGALDPYQGYDPDVDAGIANIFSTSAYRLGHSLLSPELQRVDADGNTIAEGNLPLQEAFFNPGELAATGVDPILKGAATQNAQELDPYIVDDVRNFLFGPPGAGGLDLASLNIQRGRDHGLPDYNQARIDLGLAPVSSFAEITSDPELQAKLEAVYGDVDNIDVWIGSLAEDHVAGASVGELNRAILVDQFERLRDGDRYFYANVFQGQELAQLEATTLADIIERNTGVEGLQRNVFYSDDVLVIDQTRAGRQGGLQVDVNDDTIVVLSPDRRHVIEVHSTPEVQRVVIMTDTSNDQIALNINATRNVLAGGVEVTDAGRTADRLVVRTTQGADVVQITGTSLDVNGLKIETSGFERLLVLGRRGNDVLDGSQSTFAELSLRGGGGSDRLIGSALDDRLDGGSGNDVLIGNAGDDLLIGGRGRDSIDPGLGNDRIIEELTIRQQQRAQARGSNGRNATPRFQGQTAMLPPPATPPTNTQPTDRVFSHQVGDMMQDGFQQSDSRTNRRRR